MKPLIPILSGIFAQSLLGKKTIPKMLYPIKGTNSMHSNKPHWNRTKARAKTKAARLANKIRRMK